MASGRDVDLKRKKAIHGAWGASSGLIRFVMNEDCNLGASGRTSPLANSSDQNAVLPLSQQKRMLIGIESINANKGVAPGRQKRKEIPTAVWSNTHAASLIYDGSCRGESGEEVSSLSAPAWASRRNS